MMLQASWRGAQVEIGTYLVADPESLGLVEPGEGPLDDPASLPQAGTMGRALTGDLRCDAAGPEEAPVLALAQHLNDAPRRSPVIRRQPLPPRRTNRQQRRHTFPQVIRHRISRHPTDPADATPNCHVTQRISF